MLIVFPLFILPVNNFELRKLSEKRNMQPQEYATALYTVQDCSPCMLFFSSVPLPCMSPDIPSPQLASYHLSNPGISD